jgi:spore maturation protein CgeB
MPHHETSSAGARVLLLDTTQYLPTSPLFAEALQRFESDGIMTGSFVDEGPVSERLSRSLVGRVALKVGRWKTVGFGELHRRMMAVADDFLPDIVLVVKGAHLPLRCLREIKRRTGAILVNFATDDPFNPRNSSREWLSSLPEYDVVCTPRRANIDNLKTLGIGQVHFVPFGYKPDVHFPEALSADSERRRFESDVCFIGGADADRLPYFERLVDEVPGLRLALYGGYWDRSPRLARFWRGLAVGRNFRLAVAGAAVSVNLVRRANRDDHVMRTFEIPACRGCLLTETSSTHRELFRDGRDAFFFESPDELVRAVRYLLANPLEREQVAHAGHAVVTGNANRYDDRLLDIVRIATKTVRAVDRNDLYAAAL